MPQVVDHPRHVARSQGLHPKLLQHLKEQAGQRLGGPQRAVQGGVGETQAQGHGVGSASKRGEIIGAGLWVQVGRKRRQGAVVAVQASAPKVKAWLAAQRSNGGRAQVIDALLLARLGQGERSIRHGAHVAVFTSDVLSSR